jgi:hypothetical protein
MFFFYLYQYKIIVEQKVVQKFGTNIKLNALITCSGFQALSSDVPTHVSEHLIENPPPFSSACGDRGKE